MIESAHTDLALEALRLSRADQTEILVLEEAASLTRFTHNAVHQNVAESDLEIRVRAVLGKRTGVAATNRTDSVSLRETVERAQELARFAPEDPQQQRLPGASSLQEPTGVFFEETAAATPATRADLCRDVFSVAERSGCWAAGFAQTHRSQVCIVNSSGAKAAFSATDCGMNVKMNAADSTGFAEAHDRDVTRIDARGLAELSAEKALRSASPQSVEPGMWTVVLEPAAFGELLIYLSGHFSAQSVHEGSSFLCDGLGRSYFSENVTIWDDYAHPLAPGMPFDYEGSPRRRVKLIDAGVGRSIVTDSSWARRLERENTGNALPAPNAYGPQPAHIVVEPGSKPVAELIAETKRGLLVSRFWYIRVVDQRRAIVTGMTRDGTFLIEDGRVRGGVRNLRFNQSILEALRRCEFSNALHRTGGYSYSLVVPAAKIEGFTFSSETAF